MHPMDLSTYPLADWPTGFYVLDSYAATIAAAYIAGPFDTPGEASADALERNIAGDLLIGRHVLGSVVLTDLSDPEVPSC
jgi:hypothetical protein